MIIAEDLLLLAYDDASGTAGTVWNLEYRLAGALLVELALEHRIDLTGPTELGPDGRPTTEGRVAVRDGAPTGHRELDAALATVAEKARKPSELVEPLSRGLKERLLEGLAERGVLRREQGRILGIFPTTRWPADDSAHEAALRERLAAVLLEGAAPDARTTALLAVLQGSGLVGGLVPRDRRRQAEARAKELAESGWATEGMARAIDELTAIMVAVLVPTVIVPAVTS